MKTEITFYFMRNRVSGDGDYTNWTAVTDPAESVCFEVGDDYFEGNAGDIPDWCEKNGHDCVVHTETKDRFIDWEGKEVFKNERDYLNHKEWEQAADDYGGDWQ